jgi:hypothetical protein
VTVHAAREVLRRLRGEPDKLEHATYEASEAPAVTDP